MMNASKWAVMTALALGSTAVANAQQPQAEPPAPPIPAIGDAAPDFSFRPITRDGIAESTKKLSDYRGQTVVLWFFVRARTRG